MTPKPWIKDLKVGDHVYRVPRHWHWEPSIETIVKIGRKWWYVSERRRFDECGNEDTGQYSSMASYFKSPDDYAEFKRVTQAWNTLSCQVENRWGSHIVDDLTREDIIKAAELLKLNMAAFETDDR